jgi:hypothetical protein
MSNPQGSRACLSRGLIDLLYGVAQNLHLFPVLGPFRAFHLARFVTA